MFHSIYTTFCLSVHPLMDIWVAFPLLTVNDVMNMGAKEGLILNYNPSKNELILKVLVL